MTATATSADGAAACVSFVNTISALVPPGLDALPQRLGAGGVEHEPIETYSNGVRHVKVPDPDGMAIALAESDHQRIARSTRGWIGRCLYGRATSSAGAVMVGGMTAEPAVPDPGDRYQVIRLGGQEAAIVPLADLQRLQAVERLAPAEVVETAEIESTLAAHRDWVAAGRPGAVSHERVMAELLAGT